jgi:ParB family chromosome partitioning protein
VAERKGGLGRGLGALIPAAPAIRGAVFREIPPTSIVPNPRQPRQAFDADALAELVASITEVGVLQPVVVRQTGLSSYELVMGERRWRAAQAAGLDLLPAIVRETPDDALLRDALLENLHREQLNPLEEAAAYQQLLEEFGATHEELARRVGRSRPQISNTIRLLNLPAAVQRRVAAGVLSAGHARALLGLADSDAQERLATRIVAEGLSVRSVEELVSVGDGPPPTRAPRRPRAQPTEAAAVASRLSERFDTRVKVEVGRAKGRITIEFGGSADLQRILDTLEAGPPST